MGLCEVCAKIDVRQLLQTASSLKHIKGDVNENKECPCCSLQEYGLPHHETYAGLKAASDHGCDFCRLIRHLIIEEEERRPSRTEETLLNEAKWGSRPVVLVPGKSDAAYSYKGEPPLIEIRVECRSRSDDLFVLYFEAVAPRGMLIMGPSPGPGTF